MKFFGGLLLMWVFGAAFVLAFLGVDQDTGSKIILYGPIGLLVLALLIGSVSSLKQDNEPLTRATSPNNEINNSFDAQLKKVKKHARNADIKIELSSKGHRLVFTDDLDIIYQTYVIPTTARRVLITECFSTNEKNFPALIWVEDNRLNLIGLLKYPFKKSWSLLSIQRITFESDKTDKNERFNELRIEPIGIEFSYLLQSDEIFNNTNNNGVFEIAGAIKLSKSSGYNLFATLPNTPFNCDDNFKHSSLFPKELWKLHRQQIFRDIGVITQDQYDTQCTKLIEKHIKKNKNKTKAKKILDEAHEFKLITDDQHRKLTFRIK